MKFSGAICFISCGMFSWPGDMKLGDWSRKRKNWLGRKVVISGSSLYQMAFLPSLNSLYHFRTFLNNWQIKGKRTQFLSFLLLSSDSNEKEFTDYFMLFNKRKVYSSPYPPLSLDNLCLKYRMFKIIQLHKISSRPLPDEKAEACALLFFQSFLSLPWFQQLLW